MTRIAASGLTILTLTAALACSSDSPTSPSAPGLGLPFSSTDLRVGTGVEATNGRRIVVNYSGWLYSTTAAGNKGSLFDAGTYPPAGAQPYVLGGGGVIVGWERGIPGMRVGGLRRLVIPPELAYGSAGRGPIPPNATLLFEIELVLVQ